MAAKYLILENRPNYEIYSCAIDYVGYRLQNDQRYSVRFEREVCISDSSMNHDSADSPKLPAPCLVDKGIVVNKADMMRLLNDLGQVTYADKHEDGVLSEGMGYVMDVFAEPGLSTLVANQSLYLNVHSFDYLKLGKLPSGQAYFELVQENRALHLVPMTTPMQERATQSVNAVAIEAIVAEALSASWDACLDDDRPFT